jgi:hypothetical protein
MAVDQPRLTSEYRCHPAHGILQTCRQLFLADLTERGTWTVFWNRTVETLFQRV